MEALRQSAGQTKPPAKSKSRPASKRRAEGAGDRSGAAAQRRKSG
jgi:hypothetical protein